MLLVLIPAVFRLQNVQKMFFQNISKNIDLNNYVYVCVCG